MEEHFLYKQIAAKIRTDILSGAHKPGERLPSIRDLRQKWNCNQGTIQRAYHELAQQGLVTSRAGKGTHVVSQPEIEEADITVDWRLARMVNRAEAFLVESLMAGYSLDEVHYSIDQAQRHLSALHALKS